MIGSRVEYPTSHRLLRAAMYASYAAGGAVGAIHPSEILYGSIGTLYYLWAILIFLGGALGFWTAVTDKWIGEYAGIPALFFSFLTYGLAMVVNLDGRSFRVAFGLLFIGVSAGLFARWRDVKAVVEASKDLYENRHNKIGEPGGESSDG